jgi:hypothetical protein
MAIQELTKSNTLGISYAAPAAYTPDRFAAASGVVGFALAIAAIVVGATTSTIAASPGAAAAEVARAYANVAAPLVWVGALLQILALLALFGFATYLGSALRSEHNTTNWLRKVTAAAGQTFVGLTLAGFAIGSMARFRAGPDLNLPAVLALFDIHVALYVASWAFGALFMTAITGLGLQSRALPIWLSVSAGVVALFNLAAVAMPTTPLASFPNLMIWLWVVAASVVFLVRSRPSTAPIKR